MRIMVQVFHSHSFCWMGQQRATVADVWWFDCRQNGGEYVCRCCVIRTHYVTSIHDQILVKG
jgi:hypothetical protein